jgi:hypothetical protein
MTRWALSVRNGAFAPHEGMVNVFSSLPMVNQELKAVKEQLTL